jgi:hypothetical protein
VKNADVLEDDGDLGEGGSYTVAYCSCIEDLYESATALFPSCRRGLFTFKAMLKSSGVIFTRCRPRAYFDSTPYQLEHKPRGNDSYVRRVSRVIIATAPTIVTTRMISSTVSLCIMQIFT